MRLFPMAAPIQAPQAQDAVALGPSVRVTVSAAAMISLVVGGIAQAATVCLSAVIASHAFIFLAAQVKSAAAH